MLIWLLYKADPVTVPGVVSLASLPAKHKIQAPFVIVTIDGASGFAPVVGPATVAVTSCI